MLTVHCLWVGCVKKCIDATEEEGSQHIAFRGGKTATFYEIKKSCVSVYLTTNCSVGETGYQNFARSIKNYFKEVFLNFLFIVIELYRELFSLSGGCEILETFSVIDSDFF